MDSLKERDIKVALLKSIKSIKKTTQHGRLHTDDAYITLNVLNGIWWKLDRMETYVKNVLNGPEKINIKFSCD